jgi:hypothetical protein
LWSQHAESSGPVAFSKPLIGWRPSSGFGGDLLDFNLVMHVLSRFLSWRSRQPVSVIVPTRDAGAELEDCLGAVLRQRGVGPLELLVVDSGSEDDTVRVARRFGAKLLSIPRAEFNHAETRDRAVAAATSEFVLLTVQDAVLRHATRFRGSCPSSNAIRGWRRCPRSRSRATTQIFSVRS